MPGKTGIDFFESILDMHPNPIRILLTAYSDINSVIDAINKGSVYRYVTKPWNDYDLKLTIENAYQLFHLEEQNNKLNVKYKRIFSESSDPILLFDTKGQIIDFNKSATTMFGSNSNNINFLNINSIIKDKRIVEQLLEKLKIYGVINSFECQLHSNNKEIRTCLLSVNKITNNFGTIISYQATIKDITQHIEMSQLLLKKTIETQEQERERIAQDLHDGVGQSLVAIKMHLESLKDNYNQNNSIKNELETIPKILKDTIEDLRRICFNTLPLILQEHGLIKTIEELQSKVYNAGFKITFDYKNDFSKITKSLEISIFRIIQEFVNNSIKHSEATEVIIDLESKSNKITLNLKDNGTGFNINNLDINKGAGLKNIQNRINYFRGEIKMNSIINKGTEFDIAFPIELN